jgi:hypothetical protein
MKTINREKFGSDDIPAVLQQYDAVLNQRKEIILTTHLKHSI